eukprot:364862-Chlamydomonas_euryale.AAC.5
MGRPAISDADGKVGCAWECRLPAGRRSMTDAHGEARCPWEGRMQRSAQCIHAMRRKTIYHAQGMLKLHEASS